MVKNTEGGSKHKNMARKYVNDKQTTHGKLRYSQNELEYYAHVTTNLGGGMCYVECVDGKKRLCIIRGKFKGRGKRDNVIAVGKWVLVGGRDFEAEKSGIGKDLEKCDLLEIYSDSDKERLKELKLSGFKSFLDRDNESQFRKPTVTDDIVFTNNTQETEYNEIVMPGSTGVSTVFAMEEGDNDGFMNDEFIDIDDI